MKQAVDYIESFIPKTDMTRFPGSVGLERTKKLMSLLGKPQEKIKVVHIAGTSGKGSTVVAMSALLQAHGKKVGLHVKPHMTDIRERFQINGTLVAESAFLSNLEEVKQAIAKLDRAKFGPPTYFEVIIALAYLTFAKENVDYAVVEAGVGGMYDGSNTVQNPDKLCLLTRIGFDHMAILGNTLAEIANQKAHIMQAGNTAISVAQEPEVQHVFEIVAAAQSCTLKFLPSFHTRNIRRHSDHSLFDFSYGDVRYENLKLNLAGDYQVENTCLALAGLITLAKRDGFSLSEGAIRSALATLQYPGRFQIMQIGNKTVIIDGAHNEQKMAAFLENVTALYPGKKYCFIVGFKVGKEIEAMVKQIAPLANRVYTTGFFNDKIDFVAISETPEKVAELFRQTGCANVEIQVEAREIVSNIHSIPEEIVIITGSLYLIADIYPTLQSLKS